jgi:predicted class III extradiol MEMO1 family dioxygenase
MITHTHPTICCHIIHKYNNTTFIVLISDFNKERYELPEDDLKMDRNMLSVLSACNAAVLDEYITIYS